jgi:hypothetical protein
MVKVKVKVDIDELVLRGFKRGEHVQVVAAFELELAALIRKNGLPPSLLQTKHLSQLKLPQVNVSGNLGARETGSETARRIYRQLQ